jgi:hypothetical protein
MVMPWRVIGVVNLAGPTALESILPIQSQLCGAPVVTNLIEAHPLKCPRGKAGFAVKSFADTSEAGINYRRGGQTCSRVVGTEVRRRSEESRRRCELYSRRKRIAF